jgi:hypothetical protein
MRKMQGLFIAMAVVLLCSCSVAPLLTSENFNAIATGADIAQIEEMYGAPFDVTRLPNGLEEHRYIQRIYVNENATDQIEHVFIVKDGRVIGKQLRQTGGVASFQFQ